MLACDYGSIRRGVLLCSQLVIIEESIRDGVVQSRLPLAPADAEVAGTMIGPVSGL